MTYKDRTFCASKTDNHTCGREMSDIDKTIVEMTGELVAYAKFCEEEKLDIIGEAIKESITELRETRERVHAKYPHIVGEIEDNEPL